MAQIQNLKLSMLAERRQGTAYKSERNLKPPMIMSAFRLRQRTAVYANKATKLESDLGYNKWQQVAGDGNCYYRALLYAYINHLRGEACAGREVHGIAQLQEQIILCGTTEGVAPIKGLAHAKERVMNLLNNIRKDLMSERQLENIFIRTSSEPTRENDSDTDWAAVLIARQITSDYLRQREDWHALMHAQNITAELFCTNYVEVFGVDAQQYAVTALPLALGICVRVVLMDKNKDHKLQIINIPDIPEQHEDGTPIDATESTRDYGVHLLFRPGHYDIIYPKTKKKTQGEKKSYVKRFNPVRRAMSGIARPQSTIRVHTVGFVEPPKEEEHTNEGTGAPLYSVTTPMAGTVVEEDDDSGLPVAHALVAGDAEVDTDADADAGSDSIGGSSRGGGRRSQTPLDGVRRSGRAVARFLKLK